MRLTGSRAYYRPTPPKMPVGLVELMEGLTKEVLKHNPEDVYGFCAGHFQQLLEKRDGPPHIKLLSLKDKISIAQDKVRRRAEKRKQDYDKNMRLLQLNSGAINNGKLNNLQSLTAQTTNTAFDIDKATGLPNILSQNIDSVLEIPTEIEIARETVDLLQDNFIENIEVEPLNNSNNVEVGESTNEIKEKVLLSNETETTNDHVNYSGNEELINIKTVNISSALVDSDLMTATVGKSNTSSPNPSDSISSNQIMKTGEIDGIDVKNIESITVLDDDKFIIKQKVLNSAGVAIVEGISHLKTMQIEDAQHMQESQTQQDKDIEHFLNNDNATKHVDNSQPLTHIEEIQENNIKETHEEESTHCIKQTDKKLNTPCKSDIQQDSIVFPQESDSNIHSENKNDCDSIQSCNNTDVSIIDQEITESKNLSNDDYDFKENPKAELMETVNTDISENEIYLPETNVDGDISTLITEGSSNHASLVEDLQNITSDTKQLSSVDEMSQFLQDVDTENLVSNGENLHQDYQKKTDIVFLSSTNDNRGSMSESEIMTSAENPQNDIHNTSHMDIETAAVTIQKVFRNFLFKSRSSTFEDSNNDNEIIFMDDDDKNKEGCDLPIASALSIDRRAHGITRMDTVLQTVNEEKSLSLSDDSSTLSSAATIIQAHVRGFLVRNKLYSNKTVSNNSLGASNSNEPSITSLEADNDHNKNKTVLNIHIVPEGENYLSRDESLITSMELSLDSSPPSSINLHPLGYDKSERRKQLKREDAIQSISPPSNNSGKLSEDLDSVKEITLTDIDAAAEQHVEEDQMPTNKDSFEDNGKDSPTENVSLDVHVSEQGADNNKNVINDSGAYLKQKRKSFTKMNSDEMDVVTPLIYNENNDSSKLMHSGEFHDAVLPTRVSRSDTSVVSGE